MPHFHSGQRTAWHSLSRSAVWLKAWQQSLLTTGNQRTRKKVLQKYIWQSGIWMIWEDNQSSHLCITRDRCFCLYPALSPPSTILRLSFPGGAPHQSLMLTLDTGLHRRTADLCFSSQHDMTVKMWDQMQGRCSCFGSKNSLHILQQIWAESRVDMVSHRADST